MVSFEPLTDAETLAIEIERTESQRKGRSQLNGYLQATQGLFEEGYLSGPRLDLATGTITFSQEGKLTFNKSEPAYRPVSLPVHLAAKRKMQIEDVRTSLLIQLFKNLPVGKILSACDPLNGTWSFRDLTKAIGSMEIGTVVDVITKRK